MNRKIGAEFVICERSQRLPRRNLNFLIGRFDP